MDQVAYVISSVADELDQQWLLHELTVLTLLLISGDVNWQRVSAKGGYFEHNF